MTFLKVWAFRKVNKAALWMLDIGLLLMVVIAGILSYVWIPQLHRNVPSWMLLFLVPASAHTVRIKFVPSENGTVVNLAYFWFIVPIRFKSLQVVRVVTGRSSDDLDEDDELDLCSGDGGENLRLEVRKAQSLGVWMQEVVQSFKSK